MVKSDIIEIDGIFVGTLIADHNSDGFRFYAIHESVKEFHNMTLSNISELRRQITGQFRHAH